MNYNQICWVVSLSLSPLPVGLGIGPSLSFLFLLCRRRQANWTILQQAPGGHTQRTGHLGVGEGGQ